MRLQRKADLYQHLKTTNPSQNMWAGQMSDVRHKERGNEVALSFPVCITKRLVEPVRLSICAGRATPDWPRQRASAGTDDSESNLWHMDIAERLTSLVAKRRCKPAWECKDTGEDINRLAQHDRAA